MNTKILQAQARMISIQAQVAAAHAEIQGMQWHNEFQKLLGSSSFYTEQAFLNQARKLIALAEEASKLEVLYGTGIDS